MSFAVFFCFFNFCLVCICAKSLQSCPTLCDPMGISPPGYVHGILQARILEWVAMLSSRGSSWPKDQNRVSCGSYHRWILYCLSHQGSPDHRTLTFNLQDWKLQNVNKPLKKSTKQLGATRGSPRMTMWEDPEGMSWLEKGGKWSCICLAFYIKYKIVQNEFGESC